ncbi:DWNN domain, a CCHC-type zinc finger [Trifolium repens]|nr:DWNN domain, a CCHC-type zinc finger [Trifolium repens]
MSPSQAYCFLNNLANATNENSIKVRFARMWDNMNVRKQNEMISIDMVLIDEESNYIHASLPKKFAPKFRKKNLQEGKIYVVKQFEVLANKKSYAVVKNNSSMLQFNDDTTYSEVEDDDSILLHVFEFVKYAHLESRIDKHVLTDIIGVIVDVNPIEERKVPGGKVDMLSIRLKDISGNIINVTLWGRHATIFEDTLKGNLCDAPDPNVAVITSTTSKRYQGDLSLNSSSSTKIYVNIDIPEAAELIQSFNLKIQTGVNLAMICFQYPINFQFNRSTCIFSEAPPTSNIGEEIKLKALIETPSLDWQHQVSDFGPGRGFGRDMGGCMGGGRGFDARCLHCPTNGDPNFDIKRVKQPTGIPRSMLQMVYPQGSYALPNGSVAV